MTKETNKEASEIVAMLKNEYEELDKCTIAAVKATGLGSPQSLSLRLQTIGMWEVYMKAKKILGA